jgi:hypothetical protein
MYVNESETEGVAVKLDARQRRSNLIVSYPDCLEQVSSIAFSNVRVLN